MTIESTWVEYGGYIMRSRNESIVAAVLDALGISYVYEHMPYSHRGYLPDFYLPHLNVFIEVKGKLPTDEEKRKCEALSHETGCPVIVAYGKPNLFMHHDHDDGYVRREVGWMPMIYSNQRWGEICVNLICRLVYRAKGKVEGEQFVDTFDTDGASRMQTAGPSLMKWYDDLCRKAGRTSRMIYEHNEPRTAEKLAYLRPVSEHEQHCIDYMARIKAKLNRGAA